MNCECNNKSNRVKPGIKHVYGNVLRMAIPLTLRTLVKDGDEMVVTDTDFIPSSDHPVRVVFSKGRTNYPIIATMDGNVAIVEDKGKIPVGTYDISVECYDDLGNPYRFKQNAVLYVADTTAEAGIDEEIEYEAQTWYLNAAVFLATTQIGEIGDAIDAKLDDVFGNVAYDSNAKEIRFYNKDNSRVLATIDSRPFIADGTVADVYIDVGRQVLVVVLNEDAGGTRFSVPLYLIFNSYYKKDEVDSLVSSTEKGLRFDFSQKLPLVVHVTKNGSSYSSPVDFGEIKNAIREDGRLVVACVNNVIFYQLLVADLAEIAFSRVVALDGYQELLIVDSHNVWSMEDVDLGTGGGGGGYEPPAGGIPKTDLASGVQTSLGKADSAIQGVKVNGTELTPDADKKVSISAVTGLQFDGSSHVGVVQLPEYVKKSDYDTTIDDIYQSIPSDLADLADDKNHRVVTDAEKSRWNYKQNAIGDLATIRSGAAAGATALQSYTETDPTVPAWAKSATKPSYTASEVGAVPTTRTVNGKALSSNITLSASDVGALPTVISTTYDDLVTVRTNSQLIEGAWYRITDYACTTTQTDTQSAGHQFDILMQATSPNTLSEEARAIRHESDTYFANSNLEAWKIWYCLDNDTERFAWADSTNGKGVIYRMIDEWNNDCPYDFKNIQYKRDLTDGELDTENGTTTWVYTFNLWHKTQELYFDASIIGNTLKNDEGFVNGVYNNKMGVVNSYEPYYGSGYDETNFVLPNNVFLTMGEDGEYSGCYSNTFGINCYKNTFGDGCISNTFGINCSSNTFGINCYNNTFGDGCISNTFGINCSSNTFGINCYKNTFGDDCISNTFGNYCYNNTFGINCYNNTFVNAVNNVTFSKDNTYCVIVENGNQYITLTSTQTTSSSNQLGNITIAQGVNNTEATKIINHNTLNDTFRTTYTVDDNGDIYAITPTKYSEWDNKQSTLISGTNIKTINNRSLLGSGNLTASDIGALPNNTHIPADQVQSNWNETNTSSKAYIQNKPTFKTINGESIVGTGDIETGSGNVVTPVVNVASTGNVTQELQAGAFYKFGTVDSLTITLASGNTPLDGTTPLLVYGGKFTIDASSSASSLLALPASVTISPRSDSVAVGKTYEFNIADNGAIILEM